MKKFIALTIIIILTLATVFSLSSCDIFYSINTQSNQHSSTNRDSESNILDNETDSGSNDIIDESDYDNDIYDSDDKNGSDSNIIESDNAESDSNIIESDNTGSDNTESDSNDNDTGVDDSDDMNDNDTDSTCTAIGHLDDDKNDYCDKCNAYLIVVVDFYAINDLHGKFCDSASQPGIDELGTYFENRKNDDDHIVLLSSGDMWQGSAESVLSYGKIIVDWMNELGFVSMTLGNHEFDWGEGIIKDNALLADFPFLAINVYNKITGERVDYCSPSVVVSRGDLQIGIIGAIGDCYSSISSDMVTDIYFKTGSDLTNLVKAEAQRLRDNGVDLIVYSIHDGLEGSSNNFNHYDSNLSDGFVDVVFEGHTHNTYIKTDANGIVHLQGGAENYGLSHVEIAVNSVTGDKSITAKDIITNSSYGSLEDHAPTEAIEDNYSDIIEYAYATLGTVSKYYSSSEVADYVAQLYLDAGIKKWGNQYDIVLGGGFLQTRFPYDLSSGSICYADVLSLLPFNNRLVLCRVSGGKLNSQFINTSNKSYHIALKDGFTQSNVSTTDVYFIVVDMYTALYRYNGLTIIDYYDESTYARDLLAQAIKDGKLDTGSSDTTLKPEIEYEITSVEYALQEGEKLSSGMETTEYLYYKGTLSNFVNSTYGNCYLTDENGSKIYVYGLKDQSGNRYDAMSVKPTAGDVVIIRSVIKKYQYSSGDIVIELVNSVVLAINP